jgi:hypothetical protein
MTVPPASAPDPAPPVTVPQHTGPEAKTPAGQAVAERPRPADGVSVTIDGFEITVPKGTLIIRAAEELGIQIPRFCDHPLLAPIGACRQCLVQVEGQPKPPGHSSAGLPDVRQGRRVPAAEPGHVERPG